MLIEIIRSMWATDEFVSGWGEKNFWYLNSLAKHMQLLPDYYNLSLLCLPLPHAIRWYQGSWRTILHHYIIVPSCFRYVILLTQPKLL